MIDFFSHDPGRHGIDVEPHHVTSNSVRLDQRDSATHERISNDLVLEIVSDEECLVEPTVNKFGEQQRAEERARSPGEPFVNGNYRSNVLLDLLLLDRHRRNERNIEATLYAHNFALSRLPHSTLRQNAEQIKNIDSSRLEGALDIRTATTIAPPPGARCRSRARDVRQLRGLSPRCTGLAWLHKAASLERRDVVCAGGEPPRRPS